jgi:hypothetical protein
MRISAKAIGKPMPATARQIEVSAREIVKGERSGNRIKIDAQEPPDRKAAKRVDMAGKLEAPGPQEVGKPPFKMPVNKRAHNKLLIERVVKRGPARPIGRAPEPLLIVPALARLQTEPVAARRQIARAEPKRLAQVAAEEFQKRPEPVGQAVARKPEAAAAVEEVPLVAGAAAPVRDRPVLVERAAAVVAEEQHVAEGEDRAVEAAAVAVVVAEEDVAVKARGNI